MEVIGSTSGLLVAGALPIIGHTGWFERTSVKTALPLVLKKSIGELTRCVPMSLSPHDNLCTYRICTSYNTWPY